MESDQIHALLAELSTEEQQQFEQLLIELKAVNGDISNLSSESQSLLGQLAQKHLPLSAEEALQSSESQRNETSVTASNNEAVEDVIVPDISDLPDDAPTDTPFGQYVVEHIKTLCEGGSSLADAVRYAFHNKYIPYALKQDDVCKDVLQRYKTDILTLADSFKSLESAHLADAKLLVGFAWFAVVYECYHYVETYGELP